MNQMWFLLGACFAKDRARCGQPSIAALWSAAARYASALTDNKRAVVAATIPAARTWWTQNVREVLNGIFYVLWPGSVQGMTFILRWDDEGTAIGEVCCKSGISETTHYN